MDEIKKFNDGMIDWYKAASDEEVELVNPVQGLITLIDVYLKAMNDPELEAIYKKIEADDEILDKYIDDFDRVAAAIYKRYPEYEGNYWIA